MILERLTLHNFGVYRGRHVIELAPPSAQRPVILIGGLNGGGKTTFLDGLQLALYGRQAEGSNRGDLAYDEYLRRCVHRGVDPHDGASVVVELSHVTRGKVEHLEVRRWWSAGDKRDRIEVRVDGALDPLLTEGWAERVEELMPVRLSRFFFFDGEKIEALADPDRSAHALRTAIHVLLGLDLVDQLVTDLQVVERRKRAERRSDGERAEIEALEAEVTALRARRSVSMEEVGATRDAADGARRDLAAADEDLRLGGGDALEMQRGVEDDIADTRKDLERVEDGLREEAEGVAPLLLVTELLAQIARDDAAEGARAEARALGKLLAGRDARALAAARSAGAGRKVVDALVELFEADRRSREMAADGPSHRLLSAEARAGLAGAQAALAEEVPARIRRRVTEAEAFGEKMAALARARETRPDEERVADLLAKRAEARAALARAEEAFAAAEAEHARVERELAHKTDRWERLANANAKEQEKEEAAARVVVYAERVRGTMKRFRQAILDRRIRRIEALVLEGFQQLLRKDRLITGLSIDPRSFAMTLQGADRQPISPERLSAGERQLLAVSIIGALSRASGRSLPVVIDTPLGRLDSVHRERLVERYFPYAGPQVILLSTDEEIDRAHHDKLAPVLGRSYVLRHDDRSGSTTVEPGYFF
jgi:DNA sulfur modification protein DndD